MNSHRSFIIRTSLYFSHISYSNCRDSPDCTDQDCLDDREANEYGQNGRDCASKYLCSYRCAYNPADDSCLRSNCPRN